MIAGLALSSCAPTTFATFSGVKGSLPQAECQILGKTRNDQRWIDETVVAEVAGFGMARPKPRSACEPAPVPTRRVSATPAPVPAPHRPPHVVGLPPVARPGVPTATVAPVPHKPTLSERVHELNERLKKLEGR